MQFIIIYGVIFWGYLQQKDYIVYINALLKSGISILFLDK